MIGKEIVLTIVDKRIVFDLPFAGDLAVDDRVRERLHVGGRLERQRTIHIAHVLADLELDPLVVLQFHAGEDEIVAHVLVVAQTHSHVLALVGRYVVTDEFEFEVRLIGAGRRLEQHRTVLGLNAVARKANAEL